jgi:hypothetical protein
VTCVLQVMIARSTSGSCSTSTCWAMMWSSATSKRAILYQQPSKSRLVQGPKHHNVLMALTIRAWRVQVLGQTGRVHGVFTAAERGELQLSCCWQQANHAAAQITSSASRLPDEHLSWVSRHKPCCSILVAPQHASGPLPARLHRPQQLRARGAASHITLHRCAVLDAGPQKQT